jgi:hypothetical protein
VCKHLGHGGRRAVVPPPGHHAHRRHRAAATISRTPQSIPFTRRVVFTTAHTSYGSRVKLGSVTNDDQRQVRQPLSLALARGMRPRRPRRLCDQCTYACCCCRCHRLWPRADGPGSLSRPSFPTRFAAQTAIMGRTRALWLRLRCLLRDRGLHQLDIHSGLCFYCARPWSTLYRAAPTPLVAPELRGQQAARSAKRTHGLAS